MTPELVTPRLRLTYEPDVETVEWEGQGRCGVYYVWLDAENVGAVTMTSLSRAVGEIGYEMRPEFRGHGIATESVTAVIAAAGTRHGFSLLRAKAYSENAASLRVLAKTGFTTVSSRLVWSDGEHRPLTVLGYQRQAP